MTVREGCAAAVVSEIYFNHPLSEADMGLPAGSLFMASQTMENLQGAAMTAVVMSLTKPSLVDPWSRGHGRCSEISHSAA